MNEKRKFPRKLLWIPAAALALALLLFAPKLADKLLPDGGESADTQESTENLLQVHFIDVGQADCILLTCGGETMLVDGGDWEDQDSIIAYLQLQNIQSLTYVVGTHGHADHIGSLYDAVNAFPTGRVFFNEPYYDSYNFRELQAAAQRQGVSIEVPQPGDTWTLGNALVTVLGPIKAHPENLNDNSLVLRVDHGDRSLLLTGDMEWLEEQDLYQSGANLQADLLKVGHHGSQTSTSYVLLSKVQPQYAVISCGRDNEYGHPHEGPVARLANINATIYRTDLNGHVVATSDGETWSFKTQY